MNNDEKMRLAEYIADLVVNRLNSQFDFQVREEQEIDNTELLNQSGNAIGYAYVPRNGDTLTNFINSLEVIFKTTKGHILKETIACNSTAGAAGSTFPSNTSTDGYLQELLSVKLIKLKEGTIVSPDLLGPDERVHILWYTGSVKLSDNDILTTVSLGNPIQTLDRPGFSTILDGSQSQTKCSNVGINKYIFDTGHLALSGTSTDTYVKSSKESISDVITGSSNIQHQYDLSSSDFDQENSNLRAFYNFKANKGHVIDSTTKRFYDEERLLRVQAEDDSNKTFADDKTHYWDPTDKRDSGRNTSTTRTLDDSSTSVYSSTNLPGQKLWPGSVIQIEDEQM